MSNKKYVPQGVYLACDKGTLPTEFKITNNNNVFLFTEPVANTGDLIPNLNVMPFGACTVKNGSPCVPVPTAWQGFEDGIFIGNFNPLLEDSLLPCGLGGKIEIHYSLEDAQAACGEEGMSFWEIVGTVVLVVAAVALIVVTGGAVIAAVAAVGAASGALATTVAVGVLALETFGLYCEVKALYDYTQDGDEEALFKNVVLGFLFLGAGKALEKGFSAWKAAKNVDEVVEHIDEVIEVLDDVPYDQLKNTPPCFLAGTLVKTPTGEVSIDKLTLENTVLAYDFKEKRIKEKRILKLYNNWTYRYFEIQTKDNTPILATSKHLFWVESYKKWIPAKELTVGMELKDAKNNTNSILNIKIINNVDVPTYNLEVEDIHNYFVGQLGLLVHNQNKPSLFESMTQSNVEIYTVTDKITGEVVYVGQTVQGVDTRIGQHANEGGIKADWDNPSKYDIDTPKSGNWTPYEAHAWEQHYIDKNGGKGSLVNAKNAITEAKYDKFGNLHSPCK